MYPRITKHPKYEEILDKKGSRLILDMVYNIGMDSRQLAIEGIKQEILMRIDISPVFRETGYQLFGDKTTCNINFKVYDFLNEDFLYIDNTGIIVGKFSDFTNRFAVIHTESLLHLLSQSQGKKFVHRVKILLGPRGIFFARRIREIKTY